MPANPLTPEQMQEAVNAYAAFGTQNKAADHLGISRTTLQARLARASAFVPQSVEVGEARHIEGTRFLLTSAQNQTGIFKPFWENLKFFADHIGAEIMVARFRYNVSELQAKQSKTNAAAGSDDWYASELEHYFADERLQLCDGLVWAGDVNILPTATDPLSGFDSFTGLDSCIFPHAKIAMKSIATAMSDPRKKNYTTGAVTLSNYIQRKAGQKAEFHHAYGALLVEIDEVGDYFVRQINADTNGNFCDLDIMVKDCEIHPNTPASLSAGDIHATNVDPLVFEATWGAGGLVDQLKPENQFLGDVLDFASRSHHNNLFDNYRKFRSGEDLVENEIMQTHEYVSKMARPFCKTHIKKGNHDEHLERWLREGDFKRDLPNAPFYLEAMAAKLRAIDENNDEFDLLEWAFDRIAPLGIEFIPRNTVVDIAGVDHGSHGDMGPNGSRGTVRNLSKVGRKVNIEHSHSAHIFEGAYQAGTSSRLDMDYLNGPSSWSHVHILTQPNGKRQMIEMKDGKWRADMPQSVSVAA